ncbi:COG1361 S-layer family protein [Candidatus Woesearchaeota archaeon]|nr:COG1361 S-layer family protein [Candidatus Woesearchaeota archaeon]MBW3014057.1 COG1361 S-layer family protein [Candidatus Woesearchaeota archaeon]
MMKRILIAILVLLILIPSVHSATVLSTGQKSIGLKDLKITFLNQDPDPVEPGEEVDVRFRAENMGQYRIEDIMFEILTDYPFELLNPEDAEVDIGTLDASQRGKDSAIFSWKLRVDPYAIEGGSNEFEIRYYVEGRPAAIKLEPFQLNVRSRDIVLAVGEIKSTPEEVAPGQEIEISIPIMNLADSDIDDVRVKLDLEGFPFATVGSTNEQVIQMLRRREVKNVNFTLVANSDADLKTHNIPLLIKFTDKFDTDHELQGKFGVQVYEVPDYRVTLADVEIDKQEVFLSNTKGRVIVAFSNTGRGDINALNIKLLPSDDYQIITKDELYIGDLESDDYETAEFDIYVKKVERDVPLKLELTYKDSENTEFQDKVNLDLKVYSKKEAAKLGLIKQGNPAGLLIFLIIVASVGYWYYRRRKKKKQKKK